MRSPRFTFLPKQFDFPLICLRGLCLGFHWKPQVVISPLILVVDCLGAPNSVVGVCPKYLVKVLAATWKAPFVEGELGPLGRSSSENRVRPFVAFGFTHTPPTQMYFPSKGRNYGKHILVSACSVFGYFYPLPLYSLVVSCLVSCQLACHIGKFTQLHIQRIYLCVKPKLKKK